MPDYVKSFFDINKFGWVGTCHVHVSGKGCLNIEMGNFTIIKMIFFVYFYDMIKQIFLKL